jgi:hypothetical protein
MNAAALLLSAVLAVPAAPAVVTLPRPEAPWSVVVAAAPASELSAAERLLFAALMRTPEAWPAEGALERAHARGATVDAIALPDGVLIRLEGHADDVKLLMEAAEASRLLPRPTPSVLARAQGSILRARRQARGRDVGHDALWQRWFGDASPARALEVSNIALHQVTPAAFWTRYEAWAKGTQVQLFVEGRLPASVVGTEPALRAAAPAVLPVVDGGPTHVHGAVASRQALLAHPLPPGEATLALGLLVEQALAASSPEGAPPIDVDVLTSRRAALLVLKTPAGDRSAETVRTAVGARLQAAMALLEDPRRSRALVAGADARLAREDRHIGDRAARRARAWLSDTRTPDSPTEAISALLFDDALRVLIVSPYGTQLPR